MVRWEEDGNNERNPPDEQPQHDSVPFIINPPIPIDNDDDDDEDAELQAALALSLQSQSQPLSSSALATTTGGGRNREFSSEQNHPPRTDDISATTTIHHYDYASSSKQAALSCQDILEFHTLMWDHPSITTDSDKVRWIQQGIDVVVRSHDNDNNLPDATAASPPTTSLLHRVAHCPTAWGLVQNHGGPCGVLAAVQSEMLKVILFDHNDEENNHTECLSQHFITQALAKSIAIILARAAILPSAAAVPPTDDEHNHHPRRMDAPRHVKIVVPTTLTTDGMKWQDFEPWHPTTATDAKNGAVSSSSSSTLVTCTIPESTITDGDNKNNNNNDDDMMESHDVKRQKRWQQQQQQQSQQEDEGSNHRPLSPSVDASQPPTTTPHRIRALARTVEQFLLQEYYHPDDKDDAAASRHSSGLLLDAFRRPGGVLLLVLSLTATRRYDIVRHEMDDAQSKLTGQFGHCAQELINLLLTGQAVSNVFDNTLNVGMVCRGIQYQPSIGYLSQLEAMRYCEVGSYYKSPQYPIWVVGSTSHFTVLFGEPAALKESQSDILLDECRRAFKSVEGGEENGFIAKDQLSTVLDRLQLDLGGDTEADRAACIQTLAESLEVTGAGIILWDDFWKASSRLMTGASLLTVLQGSNDGGSCPSVPVSSIQENDDEEEDVYTPLLVDLPVFPAKPDQDITAAARIPSSNHASAVNSSSHMETDEEMARRLAAEWNSGNEGLVGLSVLSNAAEAAGSSCSSPMEVDPSMKMMTNHTTMSDEEMARKLQEEWDAEDNAIAGNGDSSVGAVTGSPVPPLLTDADDSTDVALLEESTSHHNRDSTQNSVKEDDKKPAATTTTSTPEGSAATQFEQYGDTFSLFHYNGLRGGVLTPFRVTRLSADEAVGASVALNRGSAGSSHGKSAQDLEDVVRTKWPSCAINWLGKQPPCID